jgi:hypothetical protein
LSLTLTGCPSAPSTKSVEVISETTEEELTDKTTEEKVIEEGVKETTKEEMTQLTEPPIAELILPKITAVVEYNVRHSVTLVNNGPGIATHILLQVSLVRDIEPYQKVVSMEIMPQGFETITDEYDNVYAEFEFANVASGEKLNIEIYYKVAVNALDFNISKCDCSLPAIFIDPELNIESDAEQIISLANELAKSKVTACEEVKALYNYVGDNVSYTTNPEETDEGALLTLEDLAGDCTDFVDLLLALSRSAGIPARFIEGVNCCTNGDYIETAIKHAWLEIYLPCAGWVPMDPTWGRYQMDRETYFAGITPDHIIVSKGRNPSIFADTPGSGHYFHYTWWWGAESTEVSFQEEWEVVKVEE